MNQVKSCWSGCFLLLLVVSVPASPVSMSTACERIGKKLSSVSIEECLSLDMQETGAHTVLGNPILYKEYPPLKARKPRARVLLIGGVHGDEYASFSVVFKWMHILMRHHSGLFYWHVVPAINLDGLFRTPAVRFNHRGVDLNRNMPTGNWEEALHFWRTRTNSSPRHYPGERGGSENEVQWLVREIKGFKPDVIITVHAPYNLLDYDGPPNIQPPKNLGGLKLGDLGTFPGSLGRYGGEQMGIPVLTVELASARFMPADKEIKQIWLDLVQWLIHGIGIQNNPSAVKPRKQSGS